ncbi:MAG: hypothetical protein J6S98_04210 [Lentisphaeria bacterium]|nr:hypothetical protein [Lentisphaeria bacterium]
MGAYLIDALIYAGGILCCCFLPWLAVAFVMQQLSSTLRTALSQKIGIRTYVYLTAPGVIVHELSHAFFCVLFGHTITDMQLFSPEEDGTLGYVSHRYNPRNLYHLLGNFFIGTGPIWGGTVFLWILTWLLLPTPIMNGEHHLWVQFSAYLSIFFTPDLWCRWQGWLWLYLAFTITQHITLSMEDLQSARTGFVFLLLLIFIPPFCFGWCGAWEDPVIHAGLMAFFALLPVFLLTLSVLLLSMAIFRLFR